jgi:hypothetical protein
MQSKEKESLRKKNIHLLFHQEDIVINDNAVNLLLDYQDRL